MGQLLDLEQTARRLRVGPGTVRYLRIEGRFAPAIKIGRRVFWDEDDVEAWLRNQKETT